MCGSALPYEAINARRLRDRGPFAARGLDDPVLEQAKKLLAEVARVERGAPDRLVDRAELLNRERLWDELERDRRSVDVGAHPFERGGEDLVVVEGKLGIVGPSPRPRAVTRELAH